MWEIIKSTDFSTGIISGVVLSLMIWGYQISIRRLRIIRVVFPDISQNRIGIVNTSLWKISNIEIKGQITYKIGNNRNRHTILIEGERSYTSPEPMKGLTFKHYFQYHLIRKDLLGLKGLKPRYLKIDMKSVVLNPPVMIQSFQELQGRLNNIYDVKLFVYIHYFGKLSTVLKIRTEKLPY